MKHKHADLIHAWADGAEIQIQMLDGSWGDCVRKDYPDWNPNLKYRIKPEEKKPVVRWLWAYKPNGKWTYSANFMTESEARKNSGVTQTYQYHKLEWSRTEFPE